MASLLQKVREIFYSAQDGDVVISKLSEQMASLQSESTESQFWDVFVQHVQKSIFYYKSEPAVERLMDFIANFATYSTRLKTKQREDERKNADGIDLSMTDLSIMEEEMLETFLLKCFTLFINLHNAREKGVRLRCCQLINKLLNLLGDEDCIDEGLSDEIYKCMMIRIKDVYPRIRIQAVLALYRLQEPTDEDCPVINAYVSSLERDINPLVRKTILTKIAITRKTLPYLIERVRDINDQNRQTAFMIISEKVSIRALSIAQRIMLLTVGLQSHVSVKKTCIHMLKSWFRSCNHSFVKLLEALDTESDPECSELVMTNLLKDESIEKLKEYKKELEEFSSRNANLTEKSYTIEKVCFWYFFCKHLKTVADGEILLDDALPELTKLGDVVRIYAEKNFIDSAILTAFEGAEHSELILKYLLNIACLLEFTDEFGRKNFQSVIHDLLVLENVPLSLVPLLIKCLRNVIDEEDRFALEVVEIISDIKQPLVQVVTTAMKDKAKQMQLQLARISVDIHECNDDLECAIKQQDYQQAALLKDHISELEKQKTDVQSVVDECQEQGTKRVEKEDDPEMILKCLTVGTAMLSSIHSDLNKRGLSPIMMTLKDDLFFDGVKNEDQVIRNEAVKGLGLLSYLKKEFASQHLVFFMQVIQVDYELVQLTAIKIIFDLFLLYGLTSFDQDVVVDEDKEKEIDNEQMNVDEEQLAKANENNDDNEDDSKDDDIEADIDESNSDGQKSKAAAEGILSILLMFLQSESSDLRSVVVEGMAKLMITGRVMSANILTRLIVAWYNPMNSNDSHLHSCFAAFLPTFAFQSRENLELVEEAFLPTLSTIANAPSKSPLSQIDIVNVINLFIQLTDIRNLTSCKETNPVVSRIFSAGESTVHNSLAIRISNEILNKPDQGYVKYLCKALNQLNLSPESSIIDDLINLSKQMIESLKNNRLAKNMIAKFLLRLEGNWIDKSSENQTKNTIDSSENQTQKNMENTKETEQESEMDENGAVLTSRDGNILDVTPISVMKNPLKHISGQPRSRRNVSFASPPHKMPRLSLSPQVDFNVD